MKLSQFSTEQSMDVLCELAPYISNIVSDEELAKELKEKINVGDDASQAETVVSALDKVSKLIPILMKKRKADVLGILAVLNGKTAEQIGKQNILTTAKQIREAVKDKELIDFFRSCVDMEKGEY